ncbi:methyltransferase domain-containing protein [Flavobacterium sp. GSP27]|uniref:Methyltransferase domain-containing protein n=1 Tax=Flavobacterium bomense TaxID=2497483 RepID=A0A3S0MES6_9FLAO|nr:MULTISPECIES: fused MFS/spermidine synthase [Flavobacterium]RTY69643.1 methyltransferase domain-containing protein [Flavobacterium sp. LB2P53]RTZ07060.1 methyltransferase domain-containing protein [Flavobacterium bomense]RTZ10810.1 methyltransferase domain-containing protein [Flavobacterium sp. GSP27]
MLKKIFSYVIPLTIYQTKSALSKSIEVTWANGELVMDSQNTNYSYGSLQRILRLGLKNIGYKKIVPMEHILVLGVAGGSVIKTLVEEIKYKGKITGVEIDPEIITIANAYFDLDKTKNLTIVIEDAFAFVLKTPTKYDLIIIDIFQDTTMPNFLFEPFFTNRVCSLLKSHGFILFNTMLLDENQNQRNKKYVTEFYKNQFKIRTIPRVEVHNELIVIEKIA